MDDISIGFQPVIDEIASFNWRGLRTEQNTSVAQAYWFFSIQFRENLSVAHALYPDDPQIQMLVREECNTANLSPWPGVAREGEAMNHDEFMRRTLQLSPVSPYTRRRIDAAGEAYLAATRRINDVTRAMSIASYEAGGLEAVFKAMLQAPSWDTPLLAAFHHFLERHIAFDSDPEQGHGALVKHLQPDHRIRPLWAAFRDLLMTAAPELAT